ncbi:TKL/DRK protein kinase [Phytophthora megakarya]|uniref:TKL/DRK protein kinase n=1 Tax=Phytophthora megakarya TaxID=4795 RepID=A0A225VKV1_9STRA|nr:TKL/DRK protein kinase [Phytophthora megakarya]
MAPSEWLLAWRIVHWVCLGLAVVAALYLLLHSTTFHRLKRRMADLLLSGIAVADLSFVALEALKQALHTSYLARYRRENEGEPDPDYSTADFVLTLLGRFSFFMSFYWIYNLSLLMRLGNLEALHVKRSLLLSSVASLGYGCMHALLPTMTGDQMTNSGAYRVTAALLFVVQITPLILIMTNLRMVRSRLNSSTQGRNVIRRLTGYCVCAAVFTLPYALVLILFQSYVGVGAITETLNYFVPIANALLFGTSLSCCCCCTTETLPTHDKVQINDTPSSSIDISAELLSDGCVTPVSTGHNAATGGVLGIRDGLLAGGPIAEMVTEGPAVKIGEGSSAEVYKAQWLGITVALKCLRFQAGSSSEAELYMTHLAELRTEFLDEAVLAAQLRHPNITLFIKMGTYSGSLCLVNEYCARGSLRDVLRANPLMDWNTRSLQSIGESVIMMDDAASELMTTFAGTWRWNAPEVMMNPNECRFNRETDMYSFGVALWEILTNGSIPFGNVDFDHQVRQLVAAGERPVLPPAYLRSAPPEFVEVLCACWHQRPEKRPSAQNVMLRLGSLSYTLANSSEFYTSSQNTSRFIFSDNYCQAMDSNQSCPGLW